MKAAGIKKKVEAFFRRYAATYARALAGRPGVDQAVLDAYADYFVDSSPVGVHGGKNGLVFRLMVKRGFARYRRIGVESMEVSAIEVTPLDALHAMARVTWASRTRRRSDGHLVRIAFTHHYVLTLVGRKAKIFASISTDEQAIMKKHGLAWARLHRHRSQRQARALSTGMLTITRSCTFSMRRSMP